MEKFAIGLIVGGLAGALLTANNYKMRTLVKKSQEEVQTKLDELLDEKIREMDEKKTEGDETEKPAEKSEQTAATPATSSEKKPVRRSVRKNTAKPAPAAG